MVYGVMSRTNGVIAISGGILWAIGISAAALRWRALASAALLVAVFGATLGDWGYSLQWARSWKVQNEILARFAPRAQGLPGGSILLLDNFPIALEPGGALVFGAHWDTGAALRFKSGRKDVTADVAPPGIQYGKDKVSLVFDRATSRAYPYENLYLYDYGKDALWRLEGPKRRVEIPAAR
jgi:hypothetical protein